MADEYDGKHQREHSCTLNIYASDDVDDFVDSYTPNSLLSNTVIMRMKEQIVEARRQLDLLDRRYITCISVRILLGSVHEDMGRLRKQWCLINVWRAQ
jgi:hypothetical protein